MDLDHSQIISENIASVVLDEATYIYYNEKGRSKKKTIHLVDIINEVNEIQKKLDTPFKLFLMGDRNQNGYWEDGTSKHFAESGAFIKGDIADAVIKYNDILLKETPDGGHVLHTEKIDPLKRNLTEEQKEEYLAKQKERKINEVFTDEDILQLGEIKQVIQEIANGKAVERHFFKNSFKNTL